ncbi:type I-MYXAN CRISPR-associated protein Cas6/Cmx6 [Desulforamulus ferrireducens]|uniref:Type I-MYXAN CRISPR-associated protein Cas6/Cmx6 n=1 Tax=Desulforamulus ferrireducens TaxID=1833852 RepID=A0A1S6IZI5_9FIRM|nr:type I-MYXAN CRISPR-associated protein Cas6/Cmx6 [Desulforamulus ferrireducens]AQS60190.1 type I-MYXAN CRISPR-associated protein Cas6/Cmx6 [Desulforamulus ferrireducens]
MQNKVDLAFSLIGTEIPADHGYLLFSALSKILPFIHTNKQVAIHPISGKRTENRLMYLNQNSYLTFRVPEKMVSELLQLTGSLISIGDYEVRVGVPHVRKLKPAVSLYSPLVVIKGFMEPESFFGAVHRQLHDMNVRGKPMLVWQDKPLQDVGGRTGDLHSHFVRRTLRVKDKEIVGFALRIDNLTAEESLRVQENGIGGRNRFGCGIFLPFRR